MIVIDCVPNTTSGCWYLRFIGTVHCIQEACFFVPLPFRLGNLMSPSVPAVLQARCDHVIIIYLVYLPRFAIGPKSKLLSVLALSIYLRDIQIPRRPVSFPHQRYSCPNIENTLTLSPALVFALLPAVRLLLLARATHSVLVACFSNH